MRIALVRHGQTDWNLELRMQGRTDIPLNATGREQARDAAAAFASDPDPWQLVVSSPLDRARETAALLAATLELPNGGIYDDLIEQDFGVAEGVFVDEMRQRWAERALIPGAEVEEEVGPRGVRALDRIAADHPGRQVLAVAHGTLIRHTLATISGGDPLAYPRLANLSSSVVESDGSGWRVLTIGGVPYEVALAEIEGAAA